MERLLSAASFYSLIFLFIMFTASQLLDKINNHISESSLPGRRKDFMNRLNISFLWVGSGYVLY